MLSKLWCKKKTILWNIIEKKDWDGVEEFFNSSEKSKDIIDANFQYRGEIGDTGNVNILHLAACRKAPIEIFQIILENGADELLLLGNEHKVIPLHVAVRVGLKNQTIQLLIKYGGMDSIKATTNNGWNALHFAINYSRSEKMVNEETIKEMIKKGDAHVVNAVINNGDSPIHLAIKNKLSINVVKLLFEGGNEETPKIITKDKGWNYLHYVIEKKSKRKLIKLVMEKGGVEMIEQQDADGANVITFAINKRAPENILRVLMDQGREKKNEGIDVSQLQEELKETLINELKNNFPVGQPSFVANFEGNQPKPVLKVGENQFHANGVLINLPKSGYVTRSVAETVCELVLDAARNGAGE